MLDDKDRIFTNLYGLEDWRLEAAMRRGAWDGTAALIALGRAALIDQVKASGLRGRGGAGTTGLKWASCRRRSASGRIVSWSAPTIRARHLQDREIMRHDPHLLVEGCLIAGAAMGAMSAHLSAASSSASARSSGGDRRGPCPRSAATTSMA
jgi:NADH-quinone oxidoreductase subunit F